MGVARSSVRRIAWTTAAVVVGVITLGLTPAVAVAAPPDTGSNITPAERDEILAQHALFRAEVGEPSLVWDNTIATGAQEWADAKQADGQFEHSSGTGLGENLAGGEVKDATMRLGTDERINYQSDPQPTGQEKKTVGHYTQIVWSSTTRVGCGFAPANKLAFGLVVCRYAPPGNFTGQFPYPVGTALIPQPGLATVSGTAGAGGIPPGGTPPADAGGTPAGPTPPADTDATSAAGGTPAGATPPAAGTPPEAGAPTTCTNADGSELSPSAAQDALTCLIAGARAAAGLPGLAASAPVQAVAATIAQGKTPPDVPAALTAAGYCPGGSITSWNYASFGDGSPKAALDYFTANAHDVVSGQRGDLGVAVAGTSYALVLAQCG
jgi:hypothetical protein